VSLCFDDVFCRDSRSRERRQGEGEFSRGEKEGPSSLEMKLPPQNFALNITNKLSEGAALDWVHHLIHYLIPTSHHNQPKINNNERSRGRGRDRVKGGGGGRRMLC
jgi:hypothetical protein